MRTGKMGGIRSPMLACALSIGISGCTTMQMLGEAGDSFSAGNVGTGIFRGVSGVLFGPVIDVFTLGGVIDSPEKARAVTQTATSVMAAQSTTRGVAQPRVMAAPMTSGTPGTPTYTASGGKSTSMQQTARSQVAGNGGTAQSSGSQNEKDPYVYTANVNHCLVVEPNTGGATRQRMRNSCSFGIRFTFCNVGRRQDECAIRRLGGGSLRAGATDYMLDDVQTIQAIVCPDPYYLPNNRVTWEVDRMKGRCQTNA